MGGSSDLTWRQKQVLACVSDSLEKRGRPPACREIMAWCGLAAPSAVAHHIGRLERAGYLERERRIARGLRLTARGRAAVRDGGGSAPVVEGGGRPQRMDRGATTEATFGPGGADGRGGHDGDRAGARSRDG